MSDRVVVMREGRVAGELPASALGEHGDHVPGHRPGEDERDMTAITASELFQKVRQVDKERYAALVALVILTAISSFLSPYFLQWQNLLNILRQVSYTGIIALGMTFVIISGGIDLSVGSMAAFVGSLGILALNALGRSARSRWRSRSPSAWPWHRGWRAGSPTACSSPRDASPRSS